MTHPLSMDGDETGLGEIWRDDADRPIERWRQSRRDDGRYEVVGITSYNGEIIWELNPERGWNAERIRYVLDGEVKREARCDLRKFGDVWFPAETRYYADGELRTTVRILEAELNQPDDPASFTLADLGVQPGMQGSFQTKEGPPSLEWQKENPLWQPTWNGREITTHAQFREDVKAGRCHWGEWFKKNDLDKLATPEQKRKMEMVTREARVEKRVNDVLSLWERYVRSFIEKYQLDESQRNTAMKILEQCQQMAWRVVKRQHPERTRLETKLEKAREEKNTKAHEKALKELRALLEPINKIFEERLKPRLEKLPTRAQRTAAKKAEKAADAERSKVVDEINRAGGGG